MSLFDSLSDLFEKKVFPLYKKISAKISGKALPVLKPAFNFVSGIYNKVKAFFLDFYETILKERFHKTHEKINGLEVKYLGKGKLKNHVIVLYIIKELLLYFIVAFLFFFMIFFCNQILLLAEKILKQRVPFADVCRLISYTFPNVISQSAPFATLVGFLMCLGRLMSDNEILILRASGQSYILVMVPVLILGLVISIFSFFVNDYLLPLGTIKYNQLYREILASNPGVEIESNTIKHLNNSTIVIGEVDGTEVSDLIFFDKGKDGNERIIVAGKSSLLSAKKEGVLMQMNMKDAVVTNLDVSDKRDYEVIRADNTILNIFDSSVFGTSSQVSPREMTSYDLHRTIKKMEAMDSYSKKTMNRYIMEYNKKFATPFGSIFFAMLALPLAFLFGKHNGQTIGLIIGLFICLLYWTMMILGQIFSSRNGISGFWAMWFPDLLIGLSGIGFYIVLKKR